MKARRMLKYVALFCLFFALFSFLVLVGYIIFFTTNLIVISKILVVAERLLWIIGIMLIIVLISIHLKSTRKISSIEK